MAMFEIDTRIEVYAPGGQHLLLKQTDLTVTRLSRVFKIKPDTLYLEEDITNNAEFPDNGVFDLGQMPGSKYKVCGETSTVEQLDGTENAMRPRFIVRGPGVTSGHGWGQPRPWASESFSSDQSGPSNALLRKKPKYDSCLKRTIPYVSLATDSSGRNMCVDSIVSNVYVKIPNDTVCTQAILSDVAAKIGTDDKELTLLDSKFVPVTDDDDKDIEFWRMPSRRFYVARAAEFEEIQKTVKRKKMSLKRKHYVDLTTDTDNTSPQLGRIEDSIKKVAEDVSVIKGHTYQIQELVHCLECKICKDIPNQPVLALCCGQVIGCSSCFERCINGSRSCPLCRAADPQSVAINGYEGLYSQLRLMSGESD